MVSPWVIPCRFIQTHSPHVHQSISEPNVDRMLEDILFAVEVKVFIGDIVAVPLVSGLAVISIDLLTPAALLSMY